MSASTPRRSRWRRAAVPVLSLALGLAAIAVGISQVGLWLVVADPLTHAQAIVVLSGDYPFRAMEAASIYRQGWAPEVWLTRPASPEKDAALARLGIQLLGEDAVNRQVLQRLEVPARAIRPLTPGVQNTVQEVLLIAGELERAGGERVILVTSKPHSRRVRATWRAVVDGSLRAVVRYATDDPYDPRRWWQNTRDALAVSREVFALMNVWAGFPVTPDRRREAPEQPGEGR